jgi:Rad3-related DNA helicase
MKPRELGVNKDNWRPFQEETAARFDIAFNNGVKQGLLQSAMGTGKSIIAYASTRLSEMQTPVSILTIDHELQKQYLRDIPNAKILWGRDCYVCAKHPELSCEYCDRRSMICAICPLAKIGCKLDAEKQTCDCRSFCKYEQAKFEALISPYSLLTMMYFIKEANGPGLFSGRDRIIVDEADRLPDVVGEYVGLFISATTIARYNIPPAPVFKTKSSSWKEWGSDALKVVDARLMQMNTLWGVADVKEQTQLERLQRKLQFFTNEVSDDWVWDQKTNSYKPITIARYVERFFWRHASHFLCMSGTLAPIDQYKADLAIDAANCITIDLPSPFDPNHNLTHVRPVANMSSKTQVTEFPKFLTEFNSILDKHPREKGVCHCVSYEIAKTIRERSRHSNRLLMHDKYNRQAILRQFMDSSQPLVLLSPSSERGLDLKDDLCRFQIMAKVPYGYIGDKQIEARLYGTGAAGRRWYAAQVVRRIMQAMGRGCRSETDYCENYILDSAFIGFYQKYKTMFPLWFRNTIRISDKEVMSIKS